MQPQRRRPPVPASPVALNNNANRPMRQVKRSMPTTVSQCFGCSQPMHNPLLSNVLDRLWHPDCVRCAVCRCTLNEQCYSREGKLYCKDDFIKKYIHRCFSCQNLIQSQDLIRRVRLGRIYHADCFACHKCKRTLQDDDIAALMPSDGSALNDMDYLCRGCANPNSKLVKPTIAAASSLNADEDETTDSEVSTSTNRRAPPADKQLSTALNASTISSIEQQLSRQSTTSATDSQVSEPQPMQMNEISTPPPDTSDEADAPSVPAKATGRQTKARLNSTTNSNKRSTAKSKAAAASRQKQAVVTTEKKKRPPATRSKSSTAASATVQTRSSNRRNTKSSRYRKRTFSSGSDEDESEDEDDEDDEGDMDFSEEDHAQDGERESTRSAATKTKASKNASEKKAEAERTPITVTTSLPTQSAISEPLSLLSGLSANPISVSSIIQSDIPPSFLPPNFNPAFPMPQQFLASSHPFPPGFPLQPRMPIPPPMNITQPQPAAISETHRSSHSTSVSETDSLDRPLSPAKMDTSTSAESGTAAPPKVSALSSLLEFGTVPPSNVGDLRPAGVPASPYPFPFVTPGPGVPFSPQAAAGMTTYYRPPLPFAAPPSTAPLDINPSLSVPSKKKSAAKRKSTEVLSQNILDDPSPPKKKARKTNPRGKGKAKKNETDGENDAAEEKTAPSPPAQASKKKKKKSKKDDIQNNASGNDDEAMQANISSASQNLLTQIGLGSNSLIPPPLQTSSSTNGITPIPSAQQQAQIAAMYNMTPHFGAYNAFPGAFNPAFPGAAYPGGYPPPYGFHPAFGTPQGGQPFPFIPPTSMPSTINSTPSASVPSTTSPSADDKPAPIVVPETRPSKSKAKKPTSGEKKKPATPRSHKKKSTAAATPAPPIATENDEVPAAPSVEAPAVGTTTSESTPPPAVSKRRVSGTESEDPDDQNDEQQQQQSQAASGKSGNESDASTGAADRSSNNGQNASSGLEKKGGRTTIKPQQLEILNKAFESCAKPNKTQREQLATDTGLNLRVIQVWFQNKRSKERKGKISKEKEAPLDDDDAGDDSPPSSPQPPAPASTSTPEFGPEPALVSAADEPESQS